MTDITMEELMNRVISSTMENMNLLSFVTMIVGDLLLIPIFWWMHNRDLKQDRIDGVLVDRGKVPAALYALLVIAGAASCLGASNMISMSGLVEASESYSSAVEVLYSSGIAGEMIVMGVIAPVTEELLFRGLVYRRFKEFTPVIPAMIWASLIFALLHGNLVQGIYAFVAGFLLCYVYERYGSMAAPIIMHMASNMIAVIASETGVLKFMYGSVGMFYGFTFVCCLIVVAVVYLIERYVRPVTEEIGQENM